MLHRSLESQRLYVDSTLGGATLAAFVECLKLCRSPGVVIHNRLKSLYTKQNKHAVSGRSLDRRPMLMKNVKGNWSEYF